jgi:hypothetical protein
LVGGGIDHTAVLAIAVVGLPSNRSVKGDLNAMLHAG